MIKYLKIQIEERILLLIFLLNQIHSRLCFFLQFICSLHSRLFKAESQLGLLFKLRTDGQIIKTLSLRGLWYSGLNMFKRDRIFRSEKRGLEGVLGSEKVIILSKPFVVTGSCVLYGYQSWMSPAIVRQP